MSVGLLYTPTPPSGDAIGNRTGGDATMTNLASVGGEEVRSATGLSAVATVSTDASGAVPEDPRGSSDERQRRHYRLLRLALGVIRLGPVLMLIGLVIAMTLLSPVFFTTGNASNVLAQTAAIAVLAIGQLLVILTRGIDLSVGSTLALTSVVGAIVFSHGAAGIVVIAVMLATGAAVGLVNGGGYVWGRLPHPFIITLATLSIARGLALQFSGGQPKRGVPSMVKSIGDSSFHWVPYSAVLVVGIALLMAFVLSRMVWGRWIYATGGNPEAARRTGIPVRTVLISVYVLCGLLAGVAGIITSGRLNAGSPTSGNLAELDSIAAVIIGGASFLGGRGNVANALVGALMIGVIRNGMNLLNVGAFMQPIVIGIVIVLAVESDVLRGRLEERFRVIQAALS
jgi:ribose transport system permease protein